MTDPDQVPTPTIPPKDETLPVEVTQPDTGNPVADH
jgi:hypothetical protein